MTTRKKAVAGVPLFLAAVLVAWAGPVRAQERKVDRAQLEAWWADLAGTDEGKVARATLGLAAAPREGLPFLKERLRPVKVEPARVKKLIAQLDSDKFDEREESARELEYLERFVKADLEKALKESPSAELKKRVKGLLDRLPSDKPPAPPPAMKAGSRISVSNINGEVRIMIDGKPVNLNPVVVVGPSGPPPQWQRVVRVVAVLEHVGTPEARKVLQALAEGEKDALPTRAAQEALGRLKK